MAKESKQAHRVSSKKEYAQAKEKDNYVSKEENSSINIKSETYKLKGQSDAISKMLSNEEHLYSEFDLINMVAAGVTKRSIDQLASNLGISRKSMAENILDVSVKTMERKSAEDKVDKKTSSHAIEIARVMQHAYQVFEDEEKVKRWINRENKGLNGIKPISLFDTLTGLNLVNDILGRIEEGVYS